MVNIGTTRLPAKSLPKNRMALGIGKLLSTTPTVTVPYASQLRLILARGLLFALRTWRWTFSPVKLPSVFGKMDVAIKDCVDTVSRLIRTT